MNHHLPHRIVFELKLNLLRLIYFTPLLPKEELDSIRHEIVREVSYLRYSVFYTEVYAPYQEILTTNREVSLLLNILNDEYGVSSSVDKAPEPISNALKMIYSYVISSYTNEVFPYTLFEELDMRNVL